MESESTSAADRWYEARRQELRAVMWEWDPLGIMGVALTEYDCLVDPLIGELSRGVVDAADLKAVLRRELQRMGDDGYSNARVEAESTDDALDPIVQRISSWWESVPLAP
jgi:hypothetical protein